MEKYCLHFRQCAVLERSGINLKTNTMYQSKKLTPSGRMVILLLTIFFGTKITAQIVDSTHQEGVEVKTFYSKILGEKRKITIQTPPGMNSFDAFPVLYVLDGEALAEMEGAQVSYLSGTYKIIPNLIVVGIQNTDRMRDLTPTHAVLGPDGKQYTSARSPFKNSGGGEKFLQFIMDELRPYIEAKYHPAPYRILCGHSLGALMAVHCLVNHPGYFNAYIAISPSLQWDEKALLKQAAEKLDPSSFHNKILFFSDANEDPAFHHNQLELDSILKEKLAGNLQYKRMFYPEETHISEPVKAFYDGIRFVYPNWHLPYNSSAFRKTMSSKIIKEHYAELSKAYGYTVVPLHDEINQISKFMFNDPSHLNDAIELLEMNAQNYPASPTVQKLLGDAWMKKGDQNKAMDHYHKSSLLDTHKENGKGQ
jgi:predicted alpha/beta superfamily hydrolase